MSKWRPTALLILTSMIVATNVTADVGDVCNIALTRGQITDNYDLASEKQVFNQYKNRLCDQKFFEYNQFSSGSASLGLDLPLTEGLLGLSGSQDQKTSTFKTNYSNFCQATYESFANKDVFRQNKSNISSTLISGWVECMRIQKDAYLQKHGVFTSVRLQDYEIFDVDVTVRTYTADDVKINAVFPDKQVICTRDGATIKGGTKISNFQFGMTCKKAPNKVAIFSIETQQGKSQQTEIPGAPSPQDIETARTTKIYNDFVQRTLVPGEIRAFAISESNTIVLEKLRQVGWISAEGQSLAKSYYPELWLAIGNTWGTHPDDGSFVLPDLRGIFLRGFAGQSGRDPEKGDRIDCVTSAPKGNHVGSCQHHALQDHKHNDKGHTHPLPFNGDTNNISAPSLYDQGQRGSPVSTQNGQADIGPPVGANVAQETRPENAAVYYFIYAGRPIR